MNNKGGGIILFLFLIFLSGFFYIQNVSASTASVIINEVCWMGGVINGKKISNDEWIELKNNTDSNINLKGWILETSSSTIVLDEKNILAQGYFLLKRDSSNSVLSVFIDQPYKKILKNKNEKLVLKNGNIIIDSINASKEWPAGDNKTKQTMERVGDGWQDSLEAGGTPRAVNSIVIKEEMPLEVEEESENKQKKNFDIIINEIFPNPRGSDREWEFIELYNQGGETVNLEGWWLENDNGKIYEFGKFDSLLDIEIKNTIPPRGFLAIFRSVSGIFLDNNGGEIKLFSPTIKTAKQVLKYKKAEEGLSYINSKTIDLEKITTSTKKFLLNSTKIGEWVWTRLPTPGKTNQVEGVNNAPKVSFSIPEKIKPGENVFFDSSDSVDEDGDALKFSWDFGDGVKLNLAEPSHVFLEPGVYNVKLQVSDGKEISVLEKSVDVFINDLLAPEYRKEKEEISSVIGNEYSDLSWFDEADWENNYKIPSFVLEDNFSEVSLESIKKLPLKAKVKIEGVVVVEPGVFGSQYFYISSSFAFKIYNYKKDFPDLELGDFVEVQGEISESKGERYLKTKEVNDVEVQSSGEKIVSEQVESIKEEDLGRLVEIEGEVLEKKNSRVYLGIPSASSGQVTGEIVVYIKSLTGIDIKRVEEGENIKVTGLVLKISDELVVMPRGDDDITLVEKVVGGQVAGAEESVGEWSLEERDKKNDLYKYLIVIFVALGFVLGFLYLKKRFFDKLRVSH